MPVTTIISMYVFLTGLLLGSFFNVCIYRIPRNESIAFPPSHCPNCGYKLGSWDLIPVFSYLFLRGQCRKCKNKISLQYPIVELLTAILFLCIYLKYGLAWKTLFLIFLSSILIIASFIDFEHKIIPDQLVIAGLIVGALFVILQIQKPFYDLLLGFLIGGGSLFLMGILSLFLFKKEGMGGGDIKLMAVIGLFLGTKLTIVALLFSIYIGGFFGILLLILRLKKLQEAISYGPFIAIGTLAALFWGNELIHWYVQRLLL